MKPPAILTAAVIFIFLIIVIIPIIFMFSAPFWTNNPKQANAQFSIFDKGQLLLARNSLGIATGTTFLCFIFGIPLAFLLQKTDAWARGLFKILCVIPVLIPPYMHAIVWGRLYQPIKNLFAFNIHSSWGVVWVLTLAYFPFVTLIAYSGLKAIDPQQEEASLLCHGKWQTLKGITWPLLTPYIFAAGIVVFVFSAIDFGVPDILRIKVYAVEVFIQYSAFYNEKAAAILSLPLITITIALVIWMKSHMQGRTYIQIYRNATHSIQYSLGRLKILALIFCLMVLSLSAGLPIAVFFKAAGRLSNYIKVIETSWQQISYSLILALTGAFLTLMIGFFLSYLTVRAKIRFSRLLEFSVLIPLAVPAVTIGVGLIHVWNRPVADLVYATSFIILFGYIARFIPFSFLIGSSGLRQLSPFMEEAASLITSRWTKVAGKIFIPLLGPVLNIAFFTGFILSFRELGTTLMVIPPGQETLPIKIYNLMHYGADQMVAALCLIVLIIMLCLSGMFLILQNQFRKRVIV